MLRHIKHKMTPFWMLQLCGWGAFGFSMFLATASALPLRSAAIEKGVFTLIGILFTLPLRAIYQRLYLRNLTFPQIIAVSALCAYVSAMLWTLCFHLALEFLRNRSHSGPLDGGKLTTLFDGRLYHAFILIAWSVLYFGIKHDWDIEAQKERALKAEALAHQAQLQALRYQINPWIDSARRRRSFIYYGSSDTRMHVATSSIEKLLGYVMGTPADRLCSFACVEQRQNLIRRKLKILPQMQTEKTVG